MQDTEVDQFAFYLVFVPSTMRMVTTLIPSDGRDRFLARGLRVEPFAPGHYRQVDEKRMVEPWPAPEEEEE